MYGVLGVLDEAEELIRDQLFVQHICRGKTTAALASSGLNIVVVVTY